MKASTTYFHPGPEDNSDLGDVKISEHSKSSLLNYKWWTLDFGNGLILFTYQRNQLEKLRDAIDKWLKENPDADTETSTHLQEDETPAS